jgi:hypothetical protein
MKAALKIELPTLAERIEMIHEEIDDLIAQRVDELAAMSPGVPRGSIEKIVTARASGFCRCMIPKLLSES